MGRERCEGCGREVEGGFAGCRAAFDAVCAEDYSGAVPYAVHRATVDAYALQHPDAFCVSGKSLAAHLAGLLVWAEHGADPRMQRALREALDGAREIARSPLPAARGALTLAERIAATPEARVAAVERWARAVWIAHAAQHDAARRWLDAALGARRSRCG